MTVAGAWALPLSERYRPSKLSEVVGNAAAVASLRRWGATWVAGGPLPRQRAALLEGPPGLGKTTTAWALALEFGWSVVEMNASDARNRGALELVAGRAAISGGFSLDGTFRRVRDGGRTLILLDEADCLSGRAGDGGERKAPKRPLRDFLQTRYGTLAALTEAWGLGQPRAPPPFESWEAVPLTGGRGAWTRLPAARRDLAEWEHASAPHDLSDRGGLGAIAALVRTTLQPLVLTVNDPTSLTRYSPVFRSSVLRVRFLPIPALELQRRLDQIVDAERLHVAPGAVEAIVRRSGGDLRAALTDLEAIAPLPAGPGQLSVLGGRDRAGEFESFISEALSRPRWWRSVEIRDRIDAPPDDLLPWVEENAPRAARDDLHRLAVTETIAHAERLLSLARRTRHFGLWSYASELLTGGVSVALDRPESAGPVRVMFPSFLGDMGRMRATRVTRTAILQKLGRSVHASRRRANADYLVLLFAAFDGETPSFGESRLADFRSGIARQLDLTVEEMAYLLDRAADGPEVQLEWNRIHPPEPEPAPEPIGAVAPTEAVVPTEPEEPARGKPRKRAAKARAAPPPKKRVQSQLG
ncbi:MAG: AAA family ATPase [Thermoplasmata archaeon]|nr:AAA family ATPase [Thermoplasmata archaeon]